MPIEPSTNSSFSRNDMLSAESGQFRLEARDFVFRCLRGPVLTILLLAALTIFWEAKYESAHQDFEAQLEQQQQQHSQASATLYQQLGKGRFYKESYLRITDELHGTMRKGHRSGYLVWDGRAYFQLIDGYATNGDIIWSREVHVYEGNLDGRSLLKYEIEAAQASPSRPLDPEELKGLLEDSKRSQTFQKRTNLGSTLLTFKPMSSAEKNIVSFEFGMQAEGTRGVSLLTFKREFPPSPR